MNIHEMVKMIGQTGRIYARGEMEVDVRVTNVKVSYGTVRYYIEPIAGHGGTWIDATSIKLND